MGILDTFNNLVNPKATLSSPTGSPRIPFIFTSDFNLSGFFGDSHSLILQNLNSDIFKANNLIGVASNLTTVSPIPVDITNVNITNISNVPLIKMAINPQSIKWSQPKRFKKTDVLDGSIFTHFLDKDKQNNDILKLSFSGHTGNIMLNNMHSKPENKDRFLTWHRLYNLTRQPILYQISDGTWQKNNFYIIYQTLQFPQPIAFTGFYETVMEFSEHADHPFSREYNFTFIVTNSTPSLDVVLNNLEGKIGL